MTPRNGILLGTRAAAVTVMTFLMSSFAMAGSLPFGPQSMRAIEQAHAGQPFIVILWATDCAPCRGDLEMIGAFTKKRPDVPVVLIASDNIGSSEAVEDILSGYALDDIESWLFADRNIERLRFTIDPDWFGEVPRTYLYDGVNGRTGVSGALDESRLSAWLDGLHNYGDSLRN